MKGKFNACLEKIQGDHEELTGKIKDNHEMQTKKLRDDLAEVVNEKNDTILKMETKANINIKVEKERERRGWVVLREHTELRMKN